MDWATDPPRPWTRDSLADYLESEVVPQVVLNGKSLPSERTLSETLGVSRSLIREVLRGLEQRGLVDILPGKGAFPRQPSADDVAGGIRRACMAEGTGSHDLVEARVVLEGQAARLAAGRCTPDEARALAAALDARDSSQDLVTQAAATVAFHALLVRCTANTVLIALHTSLCAPTFESMIRADLPASVSAEIGRKARSLVDAVVTGEGQRSMDAMLQLLELERVWTCSAASRSDALVADSLQRATGASTSIEDLLESVITQHSVDTVTRKVAHA